MKRFQVFSLLDNFYQPCTIELSDPLLIKPNSEREILAFTSTVSPINFAQVIIENTNLKPAKLHVSMAGAWAGLGEGRFRSAAYSRSKEIICSIFHSAYEKEVQHYKKKVELRESVGKQERGKYSREVSAILGTE